MFYRKVVKVPGRLDRCLLRPSGVAWPPRSPFAPHGLHGEAGRHSARLTENQLMFTKGPWERRLEGQQSYTLKTRRL